MTGRNGEEVGTVMGLMRELGEEEEGEEEEAAVERGREGSVLVFFGREEEEGEEEGEAL